MRRGTEAGREMTSKERMLAAMRNMRPDVVPVSPDISNMIPCRLTGKPFWDIYYSHDPPLWRAYMDAVRYFRMDGWHIYGPVMMKVRDDQRSLESKIISRDAERFTVRTTCRTPAGDMWTETVYCVADPPTVTRRWIKDLKEDLPKIVYMFPRIDGYDRAPLEEHMDYCGDDAAVGCSVSVPGLHDMHSLFDGGVTAAVYAMHDYPDEFDELTAVEQEHYCRQAEMMIDARPDFLLLGASGLWTMSSPEIFRKASLPTVQRITKMCKQAELPSMLHACGKQREMVAILVNETDLDCVNPLEPPPMGDCELAELKRTHGDRIALMGNLHTTDVMLYGSVEDVRAASVDAIDAAAEGGGFILSTGDQCGRDTPDENIRAMVETARSYGRY